MKTKFKYFFVILTVLLCFSLAACNKTYFWEVAQGIENISKIDIYEDYEEDSQVLLCEIAIEDYEEIVNDILSMPAHKYFGSPVKPQGKVIILKFVDDTYDIISLYEPRHINGLNGGKISWLYFNEKDYNQLIEKWLAKS